jgi:hypothetical protein
MDYAMQFDINMVTPLLKRSVLSEFNLNFDENITASEEYNLFVRIAAKCEICVIPEVLGIYRVSSKSLTDKQMSKWAIERIYTLDQLERENPGITKKKNLAFIKARARANYYESRYLMSLGKSKEAREKMKVIIQIDWKYKILWLGMHIPFLEGYTCKYS